jgi:hypothetical protein
MIGGFITGGVSGDSAKMVVRAIGPSLAAFGVAGALQDPSLEIHARIFETIPRLTTEGAKQSNARKRIRIRRRAFAPLGFFAPSGPANRRTNVAGKKKGRTMNPLTQSKNTTILPVLIALTLGCFGLSPQALAVCQEGCLTNFNTALGEDALLNNFGVWNTAIGFEALLSNTGGVINTAVGSNALSSNTTGAGNTAVGVIALDHNTTGDGNTAVGSSALYVNTTGFGNTAMGGFALYINTVGFLNTATGKDALSNNTTGNNNIALGASAGAALTTGDDNIDIGNAGVAGEANAIRIGTAGTQTATFVAGIRETPLAQGVAIAVSITADGQLGVRTSSARFKEAIKPMDKASEAIFSLQPVTFRYKKALDPKATPQFGLVAEEVAKVYPDLVVRDEAGKPFTVRYDEVNAMLLNEFLKEHRKGEQQDATISELRSVVAKQQEQITALASQIKTVGGSQP